MNNNFNSNQDIYQKGFNDGFNAAMKHFSQQPLINQQSLMNQQPLMNQQSLMNQLSLDQLTLDNSSYKKNNQFNMKNHNNNNYSNYNQQNMNNHKNIQQPPKMKVQYKNSNNDVIIEHQNGIIYNEPKDLIQLKSKKLNKQFNRDNNNSIKINNKLSHNDETITNEIDFNTDCSDVMLNNGIHNNFINLNNGCDINKIITIIYNNLESINNKKLMIYLNDNLKNYTFLNNFININHIKNISKLIVTKIKEKSNVDLFVNIFINKDNMNYILIDKFIHKN
jgi:hypothetical protein